MASDPLSNHAAADSYLSAAYEQLRYLARYLMSGERPDHTLQATALVHEAYLKLIGSSTTEWIQDQKHFLAVALSAMRRVLVDHARARGSTKRGGFCTRVELEDAMAMANDNPEAFLVIDEMISELTNVDPIKARV